MKKLFNLISQNFSQEDYKTFKADLSGVYQSLFDRKLKPSTLDNFAARILGANNPNVLAAALGENDSSDLSFEQSLSLAVSNLYTARNGLVPLLEVVVVVDGVTVEMTVNAEAYSVDGNGVHEATYSLFLYSDDDNLEKIEDSCIGGLLGQGGVYLSDHISELGKFGEFLIENGVDLSQTRVSSLPACELLGYAPMKNRSFDSFSECWLPDLLSAFKNKVSAELNTLGGWRCSFYEYQDEMNYHNYVSYEK